MGEGRKVHCPWDLFMVSGQMYRGRNVRDTGAFCPALYPQPQPSGYSNCARLCGF